MINGILDHRLTPQARDKLAQYLREVRHWNESFNLISRASLETAWSKHLADSASLLPHVIAPVVDIGSGAGLPAIVLAILGVKDLTLVEASSKKSIFLRHLASILDLEVQIINARAETLTLTTHTIISRACASLVDFFPLISGYKYQQLLLLKGQKYVNEIAQAQRSWHFDYLVHNDQALILSINNLRRTS